MAQPSAEGIATDNQLAVLIAELAAAGEDCRSRLKALEPVLNPPTKKAPEGT